MVSKQPFYREPCECEQGSQCLPVSSAASWWRLLPWFPRDPPGDEAGALVSWSLWTGWIHSYKESGPDKLALKYDLKWTIWRRRNCRSQREAKRFNSCNQFGKFLGELRFCCCFFFEFSSFSGGWLIDSIVFLNACAFRNDPKSKEKLPFEDFIMVLNSCLFLISSHWQKLTVKSDNKIFCSCFNS